MTAPIHLDPDTHGASASGGAWTHPEWRSWLRAGAEALLFRAGVFRLAVAPTEPPVKIVPAGAPALAGQRA